MRSGRTCTLGVGGRSPCWPRGGGSVKRGLGSSRSACALPHGREPGPGVWRLVAGRALCLHFIYCRSKALTPAGGIADFN